MQILASPCDAAAAALFSELVPRMEAMAEAQAAMAERLQRMDVQRELRAALDEQRAVVGKPYDLRQGLRMRGPVCALPDASMERLTGLPVCVKRAGQGALMAVRSAVVTFPMHLLRAESADVSGMNDVLARQALVDKLCFGNAYTAATDPHAWNNVRDTGLNFVQLSARAGHVADGERKVTIEFRVAAAETVGGGARGVWWDELLGLLASRSGGMRPHFMAEVEISLDSLPMSALWSDEIEM